MSGSGIVLIYGPPAEAERLRGELAAEGLEARVLSDLRVFASAVLGATPRAIVIWEASGLEGVDVALELARHRFPWVECPLFLIRLGGDDAPCPARWALLREVPTGRALAEMIRTASEAGGRGAGNIPRILVVDDDQNMVLLGSQIVSSLGMIPLVAFSGQEALDKVRRFRPDLVLLDINMPGMDGFEVIEALKADPATNLTPIIVFSARSAETDKVRALKMGADDYVTKPFSVPELSARIDRLLRRTAAEISASSTTGLPGSVSLEQVLLERIRTGVPLGVLYADADHFKAFNDRYGFTRGDSVIRQIADIVLTSVRELGNPEDFVAHIGGDDFVVITTPDRAVPIAQRVVERFDRIIPYYYDPEDREANGIATTDRRGRVTRFPIMTISVAIVTNEFRRFHHPGEVADVAAQLKRFAKSKPGSVWVKDQRSRDQGKSG